MVVLYSGVAFFAVSAALAGLLVVARMSVPVPSIGLATDASAPRVRAFPLVISFISIVISILVYGDDILKPVLFLGVMVCILRVYLLGLLRRKWAVVLTIAPLVVAKVTVLPFWEMLGLSFATFRGIDVVLNTNPRQEVRWLEYVAYLFFPLTLLAGPMYRWKTFQEDMKAGFERVTADNLVQGWEAVLLGIAQKFFFADFIQNSVLPYIDASDHSLKGIASNAVAYSVFLYCDFAGYSNMAVGIGKMFGLRVPPNFNNPILARNPQDFWRRWHISLSEWLRDVVFMPVYMSLSKTRYFSRRRLFAQNIGIFLTLLGMGVWNGLSLNYIASGVLFGSYSVVFNVMANRRASVPLLDRLFRNAIACFVGRILGIALAMFALYVFSGRDRL